jgi:hypothetical protein
MVSPLTHWAAVVGRYLQGGDADLAERAERVEGAAETRPEGKFGKKEALYLPQTPFPPTLWRTSCGRCRFWHEGEPGEPGTCHIVGREGDPFGGEAIHYRGWCAFWMPPPGEPVLAWIGERLHPDGRASVRGEYDTELSMKARRRKRTNHPRTEPRARRAAIDDEDLAGADADEDGDGTGADDDSSSETSDHSSSETGDDSSSGMDGGKGSETDGGRRLGTTDDGPEEMDDDVRGGTDADDRPTDRGTDDGG